jgi:predicted acetyltransferase
MRASCKAPIQDGGVAVKVVQLREDQFRDAIRLSEYAFQYKVPEDQMEQRIENLKNRHRVFGILDGQTLASKLHLIPFDIYMGTVTMKMGGVAGVATYPEYRRRGHVKELLLHALRHMKDNGYPVSMLHPFSVPFYRKYGWELFLNRLKCSLSKADLVMHRHVPGQIRRFTKQSHNCDVEKVYEQFAKRYLGMLVRDKEWWLQAVYHDLFAAVYYDEQNEPQGYILYEVKDSRMTVEEFIALNGEARSGLWNFICQHDSMIKELEITTHERDPLLFSLPEPRVKAELTPYFMVRIVDVESFLHQYPFDWTNGRDSVVLHITDAFAPWNNRTVRLSDGDVTILAEEAGAKYAVRGVRLNINCLSTALFGYKRPQELHEIGLLSGTEEEIRAFERLIPPLQPFFYDFF